jgi:hypothetical protein
MSAQPLPSLYVVHPKQLDQILVSNAKIVVTKNGTDFAEKSK